LKVITRQSAGFGDLVTSIQTFPTEYRDVIAEYPILIRKSPSTGEYESIALFGFEKGENLFLDDQGWHGSFIPSLISRGPFLIGFNGSPGGEKTNPMIHIDMDSPRLSESEGEAIFLEHGGNSPYLESINFALGRIHAGIEIAKHMFEEFDKLGLIEPFSLRIRLADGSNSELAGFYTIHEEKLNALPGDVAANLHKQGYLFPAYLIISSLVNVKKLVDKKNKLMFP